MKIAFINHPLAFPVPPQRGSVQIWAHAIGSRLARSSEVVAYCLRGGFPQAERCDGVLYRRVLLPNWALRWKSLLNQTPVLWRIDSSSVESRWHQWEYSLAVGRDLRSQKCDVIHIMNLFHLVPVIRWFNPRSRIVLHMHCQWLNRLDPALVAPRLAKVDLILGCSEYITERIRRAFPQYAGRCRTVFNGVDPGRFTPGPRRFRSSEATRRILWAGRISPEKGLHVLLDAFAQVLQRYPDAQLEIIGPEEQMPFEVLLTCDDADRMAPLAPFYDGRNYLSQLQERARSLDIADRVTFTGLTPHASLVERYRQATVLVNPSFTETFGMTLVEAMSCGLPVIATRAGGMTEIIGNGDCGLLVEPGNVPGLASAILRLLEDARLRESMGRAGRQRVLDHFSWDQVADAALAQYSELLRRKRKLLRRVTESSEKSGEAGKKRFRKFHRSVGISR
jgi:glycosyltransferase involved in cell wall biosynthesis